MRDPKIMSSFLHATFASPRTALPFPICRLGLATRGDSRLTADDVGFAVAKGVNFLNWCGAADGLSAFVAELGRRRETLAVCVQFEARTASEAKDEFENILRQLHTDYVDALTFYYVEERAEWHQILGSGGAMEYCRAAQRDGRIRAIGATSHQRPLAAEMASSGQLDAIMIRYNAAHRGAETEIFPTTSERGIPVIVYTCLRWGALLRPTPDDPPDFAIPVAPECYRFALQHPAVTVALMAPHNRVELEENLRPMNDLHPLSDEEYARLAEHGQRVRHHAGQFP